MNRTSTTGTNGQVAFGAANESNVGGIAVLSAGATGGQTDIALRTGGWAFILGTTVADGFHTIRVQQSAGSSDVELFVDGGSIGTTAAYDPGVAGAGNFRWGDFNGLGQAVWDFVGVNAAVPEPASAGLLIVGSLLMLGNGFRRRARR